MQVLKAPLTLIQRFHEFLDKIGVSPKVADPFVLGLLAVVVTWIVSGTFDLDQVKLLVVTLVYGIAGVAAPPVAGLKQSQVVAHARERVRRAPRRAPAHRR